MKKHRYEQLDVFLRNNFLEFWMWGIDSGSLLGIKMFKWPANDCTCGFHTQSAPEEMR